MLKKPPSYSIGLPAENEKRVYRNNLHSMHSLEAPPLGIYNPVDPKNPNFEAKARLNLIRASRWNN